MATLAAEMDAASQTPAAATKADAVQNTEDSKSAVVVAPTVKPEEADEAPAAGEPAALRHVPHQVPRGASLLLLPLLLRRKPTPLIWLSSTG